MPFHFSQFSGRSEEADWWAHSGPRLNHTYQFEEGTWRDEDCQNIRQVAFVWGYLTFHLCKSYHQILPKHKFSKNSCKLISWTVMSCFLVVTWCKHQPNQLSHQMMWFPYWVSLLSSDCCFLSCEFWTVRMNNLFVHLCPWCSPSSPDMPENEATFAISAGGVTDAKE